MHEKFLSLPPLKQQKIINAGMEQFAIKGYARSSTNEITKDAHISKGLLFHYFRNKKEFYLFLVDHAVKVATEEFYLNLDKSETDIFNIWRNTAILKFNLMRKFPNIINFIMSAYFEEAEDVATELANIKKDFDPMHLKKIFKNVDASKFKDDIDIPKAMQVISWTMEGLIEQERNKAKHLPIQSFNIEETLQRIDHYLDVLKDCFYK